MSKSKREDFRDEDDVDEEEIRKEARAQDLRMLESLEACLGLYFYFLLFLFYVILFSIVLFSSSVCSSLLLLP